MAKLAPPADGALVIRLPPSKRFTDADIVELGQRNPDLRVEQDPDGALVVMAPAGSETGARNLAIGRQLGDWAWRDGSGVAFDSSTGFRLPNGALRSPDASWVAGARWDALSLAQRQGFAPLCPDFVVELRSPSDDLELVHAKMREYQEQGARLGWLLDPESRTAWVYRPGAAEPEQLRDPNRLVGDPVLPGFVLELSMVWVPRKPRTNRPRR
jgi:Uma2 family endonuclease